MDPYGASFNGDTWAELFGRSWGYLMIYDDVHQEKWHALAINQDSPLGVPGRFQVLVEDSDHRRMVMKPSMSKIPIVPDGSDPHFLLV